VPDSHAPAAPSPLDPPDRPGVKLATINLAARACTLLAVAGWTVIVALSLVEQRGLISFNPNHHSALMSFSSVMLINTVALWSIVMLAGRQDRARGLTEERFDRVEARQDAIEETLRCIVDQLDEIAKQLRELRVEREIGAVVRNLPTAPMRPRHPAG
jgi:hypothetical protein